MEKTQSTSFDEKKPFKDCSCASFRFEVAHLGTKYIRQLAGKMRQLARKARHLTGRHSTATPGFTSFEEKKHVIWREKKRQPKRKEASFGEKISPNLPELKQVSRLPVSICM